MKNHHTTKKGAYMSDREQSPMHTAKTPSHRTGIFATLRALLRGQGTGAPAAKLLALLAISLVALFATTASASAATTCCAVSEVSYASAHVEGVANGGGAYFFPRYRFEYSTDEVNWNSVGDPLGTRLPNFNSTDEPVEANIENLKGGTKYFVRLKVFAAADENENVISAPPNPSFTTLVADPPTIPAAVAASEVFSLQAKVSGKVIRPTKSDDVKCHFEYITDDQYKANELATDPLFTGAATKDCVPNPIKQADAETEKSVEANLTGLTPATTYHLRLVAEGAGGTAAKDGANFTTAPKVAAPSVTAVNDASEVKFNVATLTGKVLRPAGTDPALDVKCHFEYVTDAKFQPLSEQQKLTLTNATGGTYTLSFAGETTAPIAFDASAAQVQAALESLSSIGAGNVSVSSTYTIDFTGSLASKDVEQVFVDPSALEEAGVASAETTTVTEGHVGGFESPNTASCAQNPITAAKVDEDGELEVSAKAGTVATTKYHFRLVAENEGGSDTMETASTFTTPEAELPIVTIDPVEGGTFTTAHVSGTVTLDNGHTTSGAAVVQFSTDGGATWTFYGGSMAYTTPSGQHFTLGSLREEEGTYVVEQDLTGLQPSTTYSFRILNTYSGLDFPAAEANGEVAFSPLPNPEITTEPPQAPPTAENLAVTDVTATTAHFSGTVNPNAPAGPLSGPAKKAYETKWHFECVPECLDANENTIGGTVQGEEGAQTVTGDVTRLEPGTDYTVSLIVSSGIPGEPAVETFPTDKSPPSVKQFSGSSDGTGGYTLQGVVNPNKETITDCKFKWGPKSNELVFSADCSPMLPKPGVKPTTVEAHLTGLTLDVDYYSQLVVTYGAGLEEDSGDPVAFKATPAGKEACPKNEQLRVENSSLALPECRAYEMVTPPGKEGFGAYFALGTNVPAYDGGDRVGYQSEAGNLARSGQAAVGVNKYVAARTESGWRTIPNLNGPSGSLRDAPLNVESDGLITVVAAYSQDLLSSIWGLQRQGDPGDPQGYLAHLRAPDGTFTAIGAVGGSGGAIGLRRFSTSADLSHFIVWNVSLPGESDLGVYEYVGTDMNQPRRVDVDNSDEPLSSCIGKLPNGASIGRAGSLSISTDGSRIVVRAFGALDAAGGCGVGDPPADGLWTRIDGTTTVHVSASKCSRVAPAPACNAPANANFAAATPDGSRVFFTTTQQLVDADADQTNDVYACDIPSGHPTPLGDSNPCPSLRQISAGDPTGAGVESFLTSSENGDAVLFTAKGKLADNKNAFGNTALAGDHNLYAWHATDSDPEGQTVFIGRLGKDDVGANAQATPDGRYLVFTTASQLIDTDTDSTRDVYRYDADSGDLTRVSTNVFGVAGNGDFDVRITAPVEHNPTTTISDDGSKIIFTTSEPLNLAVDNNDEPDVYLWTPDRVSLISTGAVGEGSTSAYITALGQDVYFGTGGALTPADGDELADIYDARVGGGFSFAPEPVCGGESCQPPATPAPPKKAPLSALPGLGNPTPPKPCPKGKVRNKKGKCVKKVRHERNKKHRGKHHTKKGSVHS